MLAFQKPFFSIISMLFLTSSSDQDMSLTFSKCACLPKALVSIITVALNILKSSRYVTNL
jgi:hypothetical protein